MRIMPANKRMSQGQPRRNPRSHRARRTFLLLARLALTLPIFAISVWGVCQQPPPRVCTEFFKSDVVFTGKVIHVRDELLGGDTPAGWFYRMRVQQMFRGPAVKTLEVYTENASARYPLELGRSYLLFAWRDHGRLEITLCGNSSYLEKAGDAIRQIELIKSTRAGGEIAGRIGREDSGDYEGIRIVAVGSKGTYEGLTDRLSWFHIPVPEGVYKVHAEAPGRKFVPYDLTYDDPDHIVVHPGGCPQMEFAPEEWYNPPARAARPN